MKLYVLCMLGLCGCTTVPAVITSSILPTPLPTVEQVLASAPYDSEPAGLMLELPKPVLLTTKHNRKHMASGKIAPEVKSLDSLPPAPVASLYLTNKPIREGQESLLTLAVTTQYNNSQLDQLIATRLRSNSDQILHSSLDAHKWAYYQFVRARVTHCPKFLVCTDDGDIKNTKDNIQIWSFVITATKVAQNESGFITLAVYGDNNKQGNFTNQIGDIPPLSARVEVVKDIDWWEQLFKQLANMFKSLGASLTAMGAVFAILTAWLGYLVKLKRKINVGKI